MRRTACVLMDAPHQQRDAAVPRPRLDLPGVHARVGDKDSCNCRLRAK